MLSNFFQLNAIHKVSHVKSYDFRGFQNICVWNWRMSQIFVHDSIDLSEIKGIIMLQFVDHNVKEIQARGITDGMKGSGGINETTGRTVWRINTLKVNKSHKRWREIDQEKKLSKRLMQSIQSIPGVHWCWRQADVQRGSFLCNRRKRMNFRENSI